MEYSKSKIYSKIFKIVYIIIAMAAITYISKEEAKLKTPIIENSNETNTVVDESFTTEDNKENLTNIYIPAENIETENIANEKIEANNTEIN